jgi:FixJ family two-component response regulator
MAAVLLICVVDDDESVRESLPGLLEQLGYDVLAFASAEAFLASDAMERARCLILDIAMPGMSGPELQLELRHRGKDIPVIFITAQPDEALRARVLAQGAVAYLIKPFLDQALIDALAVAAPR